MTKSPFLKFHTVTALSQFVGWVLYFKFAWQNGFLLSLLMVTCYLCHVVPLLHFRRVVDVSTLSPEVRLETYELATAMVTMSILSGWVMFFAKDMQTWMGVLVISDFFLLALLNAVCVNVFLSSISNLLVNNIEVKRLIRNMLFSNALISSTIATTTFVIAK